MIYFMNAGMIPDQFSCDALTRDGRWVGNLDEKYMEKLEKGDVFVIGGKSFRFCYRRGGNIYSDATSERPNIPVWISENCLDLRKAATLLRPGKEHPHVQERYDLEDEQLFKGGGHKLALICLSDR
jgi:Lhr-like helicase